MLWMMNKLVFTVITHNRWACIKAMADDICCQSMSIILFAAADTDLTVWCLQEYAGAQPVMCLTFFFPQVNQRYWWSAFLMCIKYIGKHRDQTMEQQELPPPWTPPGQRSWSLAWRGLSLLSSQSAYKVTTGVHVYMTVNWTGACPLLEEIASALFPQELQVLWHLQWNAMYVVAVCWSSHLSDLNPGQDWTSWLGRLGLGWTARGLGSLGTRGDREQSTICWFDYEKLAACLCPYLSLSASCCFHSMEGKLNLGQKFYLQD